MAEVIDIADAVVARLNAGGFSQPFTAVRRYLPIFELPEMVDLHVTVVPRNVTLQTASRAALNRDYAIDVAVQQRATDDATIDGLSTLVEEIAEAFRQQRLPAHLGAMWLKTEYRPVYAPDHLDQLRQFTSVLTFTFRVTR